MPRRKDRRDSHGFRWTEKTKRPERKNILDPAGDYWGPGLVKQGQYSKYIPATLVSTPVN